MKDNGEFKVKFQEEVSNFLPKCNIKVSSIGDMDVYKYRVLGNKV